MSEFIRAWRTREFLTSLGIDPNHVLQDGYSNAGYFTFVYDEEGQKRSRGGQLLREFHEWTDEKTGWEAEHLKELDDQECIENTGKDLNGRVRELYY